jgi:FkbM family methyltransferase
MFLQLIVESRTLLDVEQVDVGGVPLWVRATPHGRVCDMAISSAVLDDDEYVLRPLRDGGHALRWVLDVGGHVGSFTRAVKRWWPEAQVIAAEPDPDSAALFRKNTEGLDGVFLTEAALLGRSGVPEVEFRQAGRANRDGNAAASRVVDVVRPLGDAGCWATTIVPAMSVIDLLERHGNPVIDLLKLDCEGAEGEILEALRDAGRLERVRWIRGEWHFPANAVRVAEALRGTHVSHVDTSGSKRGFFIAHRRPDISA